MSTVAEVASLVAAPDADLSARRLRWLLLWMLVMMLFVECMTRLLHDRRKITLRMEDSIGQAVRVRAGPGRRQVLIVGNSLVYEGTSQEAVQQSMGESFSVHTAGIPGSTFQDWRYGLRALFQRGSQAEVIVFGISPSQFLRAAAVTPLPVSQLWRIQEIIAYCRAEKPGPSILSELLLEHISRFFYMRDTMRIYVRKAIPGYESMVHQWTSNPLGFVPDIATQTATKTVFADKLTTLQSECSSHAELILIIVPTNQPQDEYLELLLRAAAAKVGIAMIEPIREREWPASKFQQDGYHLTPAAAKEFSRLAGTDMARLLNGTSVGSR